MSGRREITLAIEASNPTAAAGEAGGAGVAFGARDSGGTPLLLGVEPVRPAGRHDDDLMPAIDRLARRAGVSPREITRVAVSVGPGGYTGLRVAIAAGKTIAEAAAAVCVAVPSALVAALASGLGVGGQAFAVALAGKEGRGDATVGTAWVAVFAAGRPPDARAALAGRVIDADGLAGLGMGGLGVGGLGVGGLGVGGLGVGGQSVAVLVADRFLPAPMRTRAGELGMRIVAPIFDPTVCLAASWGLPGVDPVELAAVYPREPDAVTLWRVRKGG